MDKKSAFLILGASYKQAPLVLRAQQMGLFTVAVSNIKNDYCIRIADSFEEISYRDIEKIVALSKRYKITGIGTIGTNDAIISCKIISEKLGLDSLYDDVATLKTAVYKDHWRPILKKEGISIPQGTECCNIEEAKAFARTIGFPLIAKPPDSSGSKGINIVHNKRQLESAFHYAASFSLSHKVILEEYIGHNSYEVESFVINGRVIYIGTGVRKLPSLGSKGVGLGCTVPDNLKKETQKKIQLINEKTVKTLDLRWGPVHIDMVLDREDNPYIIDIGPRLVGGPIGYINIPRTMGVDTLKAVIQQGMGICPEIKPKHNGLYAAERHIVSYKEGILKSICIDPTLFGIYNIISVDLFIKPGDKILPLQDDSNRYGLVTACGDSFDEVCEKIDKFMETIIFEFI